MSSPGTVEVPLNLDLPVETGLNFLGGGNALIQRSLVLQDRRNDLDHAELHSARVGSFCERWGRKTDQESERWSKWPPHEVE
jgi:hypothetical protein